MIKFNKAFIIALAVYGFSSLSFAVNEDELNCAWKHNDFIRRGHASSELECERLAEREGLSEKGEKIPNVRIEDIRYNRKPIKHTEHEVQVNRCQWKNNGFRATVTGVRNSAECLKIAKSKVAPHANITDVEFNGALVAARVVKELK